MGIIISYPSSILVKKGSMERQKLYYNPDMVLQHGIEPLVMGLSASQPRVVSPYYSEDQRNAYKSVPAGAPTMDLFMLDIMRARDAGVPLYNEARKLMGLPTYQNFSYTNSPVLTSILTSIYGTPDKADALVAG